MNFYCITESWLNDSNDLFKQSCSERGILYLQMDPTSFDYQRTPLPEPGDLIYRVGADVGCLRLERHLYRDGVASFYRHSPFFECLEQNLLLQQHGIPVPKTVYALRSERALLQSHVDYLGGFPLILKIPGSEGGVGLIQVDSLAALVSLVDHLGSSPILMEYIEHPVSYRLVVLGDEVIASKTMTPASGEFRSNAVGGSSDYFAEVPQAAQQLALDAAKILQLEFGGVDILAQADGRLYFAELNFPCYFADQQNDGGVDISGRMLDYLIAKSVRLQA